MSKTNNIHRGRDVCFLFLYVTYIISMTTSVKIVHGKNNSVQHKKDSELATILNSLFRLQTRHWYHVHSRYRSKNTKNTLIIFQEENWQIAADFQTSVTQIQPDTLFLELGLQIQPSEYEVEDVINLLFTHYNSIHTVGLFVGDTTWTQKLLKKICSVDDFKWTHIRYTTEWILASRNPNYLQTFSASDLNLCVDFFTLVISPEDRNGVYVDRKSRGDELQFPKNGVWIGSARPFSDLSKAFRSLSTQRRTSMEGMHIPVGLLKNKLKFNESKTAGSVSRYQEFSISLMEIIAEYFGLTYDFETPTDGDTFGRVHINGSITGITGLLARREVALTCMLLSRTDNRLPVIDYVDIPSLYDPVQILYKLPKTDDGLDITLLSIIHGDMILMLLAPVVCMLVIGALVHVVTKSCSELTPEMTVQNMRRLGSFPDHICFHSPRTYVGQSGRILRASWGTFCMIFCAAYSAYLVTTFTVKQPELKLDTLEQLQESSTMKFGTTRGNSAFMTHLDTTTNKVHQEFGRRLKAYNRTHPWVISPNFTEHILKVIDGNYAYVGQFQREDILFFKVNADSADLRGYTVHELDYLASEFIGLPKNVFYKEELNTLLLNLECAGILNYLRDKYINRPTQLNISPLEPERSVSFSRVALLLYVTCGGIGLGTICLIGELLFAKYMEWASDRG